MQGKCWYFSRNGRVEGPFTQHQLRERVGSGEGFSVWNSELAKWMSARAWLDTFSANQSRYDATQAESNSDKNIMNENRKRTSANTDLTATGVKKRRSVPPTDSPTASFRLKWAEMEKRQYAERKALLNEWAKIKRQDENVSHTVSSKHPRPVAGQAPSNQTAQSKSQMSSNVAERRVKSDYTASIAQNKKKATVRQLHTSEVSSKLRANKASEVESPVKPTPRVELNGAGSQKQQDPISVMDQEILKTQSRVEQLQKSLQNLTQESSVKSSTQTEASHNNDDMMKRVARRRRRRAR